MCFAAYTKWKRDKARERANIPDIIYDWDFDAIGKDGSVSVPRFIMTHRERHWHIKPLIWPSE